MKGELEASLRNAVRRWVAPDLWCSYRIVKSLKEDVRGRRVCLFAHFDRDDHIEEYVIHHLRALRAAGVEIVFVTTSRMAEAEYAAIEPLCAGIIERDNVGLDFGSWKTGIRAFPSVRESGLLLFANDSVYGPLHPIGPIIERMEAADCDFFAVSESKEIAPHYQSYFLGFKRACLESRAFADFIGRIRLLPEKDSVIERYEVALKSTLEAGGVRGAALVPAGAEPVDNPTHRYWRQILERGAPYMKVELLRDNPRNMPIADWQEVVRSYGYDPELIIPHLSRISARRSATPQRFADQLKAALRKRAVRGRGALAMTRDRMVERVSPALSPMPSIAVGIVTYNRPDYFARVIAGALEHFGHLADLYVYNDGSSPNEAYRRIFSSLPANVTVIDAETNQGVAHAKNALLHAMRAHDYLFLLEDDLIPLSEKAVTEYIKASRRTGIEHFCFAHHGTRNAMGPMIVDGWVEQYLNAVGAWCMYTRHVIDSVGLIDERFRNAWDHVEHTHRIAKAGLTTPFWRFADVRGSRDWFREIAGSLHHSTIRSDPDWRKQRIDGLCYWAAKDPNDFPLWGELCRLRAEERVHVDRQPDAE